jgi:hypothetical protein
MGWEIAHECDPRYHCCVHDDCWPEDVDGCYLEAMPKQEAKAYRAQLVAEAEAEEAAESEEE